MKLRPFWFYYGSKYRAAKNYSPPKYDTIVEPFAGAAGYSLHYADKKVILVEKYPVIAGIWRYLINVSPEEILRIPNTDHVAELPSWVPEEARWLVGFMMNTATTAPRPNISKGYLKLRASGRMKMVGWGDATKQRIAEQVGHIRHWKIIEGDYSMTPDVEATWFIDPPYSVAGSHYIHKKVDFGHLAEWCKQRVGQVMVCENVGATWLPFQPLATIKACDARTRKSGGKGISQEALWMRESVRFPPEGWYPHLDAPGYFHNCKEVLTEVQLRSRQALGRC